VLYVRRLLYIPVLTIRHDSATEENHGCEVTVVEIGRLPRSKNTGWSTGDTVNAKDDNDGVETQSLVIYLL